MAPPAVEPPAGRRAAGEVLLVALKLGLTSFGGPIAHLGYFRAEYVERRRWLDDAAYADLVALAQLLPGPASSQVGIAVGTLRAGLLGGLAAWVGFTLPSAVVLVAFGLGVGGLDPEAGWLHGLALAAVAVVAQAVWSMARTLTPDLGRRALAVAAAVVLLVWPSAGAQVIVVLAGGLAGAALLHRSDAAPPLSAATPQNAVAVSRRTGALLLAAFLVLLLALPLLRAGADRGLVAMLDAFYRAGALVFGGGHVVLPLLEQAVVPPGWVSPGEFVAGYGAAQAVPGPLFTFAGFLGAAQGPEPNGVAGGVTALIAIFLPGALLVTGLLPFWDGLRRRADVRGVLAGVNAAVVGLLAAALYDPVATSAILGPLDVAVATAAFAGLQFARLPPWLVVAACAGAGALTAAMV